MNYSTPFFGSLSFDKVIVAYSETAFTVKFCSLTNEDSTITLTEALSASKNPAGAVFTDTNGLNYKIYARRRVTTTSWQCRDNAFILIGFEHDHPLSIDFNKECKYLEYTDFNDIESWCSNRTFYPVAGIHIETRGQEFTNCEKIVFTRPNITHNLSDLTEVSSVDSIASMVM